MSFDLFVTFDGECREAVDFYARVFQSEVKNLMLYGEMPPDPNYTVREIDKNRVLYSCVPIFGCNVMFCDCPKGTPFVKGNNLSPTIGTADREDIKRMFRELKEGGQVMMDLQATFWSELYCAVKDKYGIIWQLSHTGSEA